MKWTIRNKVIATCGVALIVTVAMAVISARFKRGIQESLDRAQVASAGIRNHFEADMAHDAVRGDVLAILVLKDRSAREAQRPELARHGAILRKGVEDNRSLALSATARERLTSVLPTLEEYVRTANALGDRAISDPAEAYKQLAAFERSYVALESKMEEVSDALEADGKAAKADTAATLVRMDMVLGSITWLALIGGATFLYFLMKSVLTPLRSLVENLKAIAEGGNTDAYMDASLPGEIGEVGRWFNQTMEMLKSVANEQQKRDAEYRGQIQAIQRSLAVVELELDGTILHANDNFLALFGYSLSEVVGRHHRLLVSDADRDSAAYRALWDGLGRGRFESGEFRRVTKNGQTIWVQGTYNPIFDATGKPVKILKFAMDITATKVETLNNTFQIDEINESSIVNFMDLEGNNLEINEKYTQLLGYSPREIVGKHFATVIDPEDPENADAPRTWQKVIAGSSARVELRARSKDGRSVWIDVSCTPIFDESGKVVRVKAVSTDITKRKRSEETLAEMLALVATSAENLAEASEELNAISQTMGMSSEQTALQAAAVASASEQVHQGVSAVAHGAEETGITIREVAHSAADAALVATQAVSVADGVNQTVAKLGRSSQEIDQVIKVITSIAEQTNLLALNATIEAARAGGAGKGFAVVANEVKELAKETAEATEDISRKIAAIQQDTEAAVSAIGEIAEIIRQIHGFQNTIASAVEEQSATMSEIGRTIDSAADGAREITNNLSGVAESAQATASGASQTQAAASRLAEMASNLQALTRKLQADDEPGALTTNFHTAPNPGSNASRLVTARSH